MRRLLDEPDLDLCLDTGHAAYAGAAPERLIAEFGPRLGHLHLKDVRAEVLARVRDEGLDFWAAIAAGVFCPLGQGVVDLPAVLDALAGVGYRGYATIEQDRVPGSGSPLDDLAESQRVLALRGAGGARGDDRRAPGRSSPEPARASGGPLRCGSRRMAATSA